MEIFDPAVVEGRGEQLILVGICSCRGFGAKREAVRQTWMRQLPNHVRPVFFLGEGLGPVEAVEETPKKKERVWFKEYANWEKLKCGDWSIPDACELVSPE